MTGKDKETMEQLNRLITVGRRVWNSLTEEEQANYYYDVGTYGFVEDIMAILRIHELESVEQFEYVRELIIENKEVYGIYAPDHDITFVMEKRFTDDGEPVSLEVKGFYYGEPTENANRTFYGDLKADFDDTEIQENGGTK